MRFIVLSLLVFMMSIAVAQAKAMYVMDTIYITVRAGAGDEFRVLETIKTGDKLEVLDEQSDEVYVKIATGSGTEGWVKKRYLLDEPIAADRLVVVERKLAQAEQEADKHKAAVTELRNRLREVEKERKRLESSNQKLSQENENISRLAAKPVKLSRENEELKTANSAMSKELDAVKQKLGELEDTSARDWFISGAVVVLIGVLIGLILPKLRMGRRSSWA